MLPGDLGRAPFSEWFFENRYVLHNAHVSWRFGFSGLPPLPLFERQTMHLLHYNGFAAGTPGGRCRNVPR